MRTPHEDLPSLLFQIYKRGLTLITPERFKTINLAVKDIYEKNTPGDIVEVGCWRGGMSIYLAHAFHDRTMWAFDSFEGFAEMTEFKYSPLGIVHERHHSGFTHVESVLHGKETVSLAADYEETKLQFADFGLNKENGVNIVKGWVGEDLRPSFEEVKEIAVLRVDVDAYSPSLVTLEELYDKVTPGGYVIFDDSALHETQQAIREFETRTSTQIISQLLEPDGTPVGRFNGENGLFMIKK